MTDKNILSDEKKEEIIKAAINEYEVHGTRIAMNTVDMTVRSVLQSLEIQQALADSKRIDWLADPNNNIGNVQLPSEVVENNLYSLRDAIDAAMEQKP